MSRFLSFILLSITLGSIPAFGAEGSLPLSAPANSKCQRLLASKNPQLLYDHEYQLLQATPPEKRWATSFPRLTRYMDKMKGLIQDKNFKEKIETKGEESGALKKYNHLVRLLDHWEAKGYQYGSALEAGDLFAKLEGWVDGNVLRGSQTDIETIEYWVKSGILVIPTFARISTRTFVLNSPFPFIILGFNYPGMPGHDVAHGEENVAKQDQYPPDPQFFSYISGMLGRLDKKTQELSHAVDQASLENKAVAQAAFEQWENSKFIMISQLFAVLHEAGYFSSRRVFRDLFARRLGNANGALFHLLLGLEQGHGVDGELPPFPKRFGQLSREQIYELFEKAKKALRSDFNKYGNPRNFRYWTRLLNPGNQ